MAADDLDTPLGKEPKRKRAALPVSLPQIIAGMLGLCIAAVAVWSVVARDPYGGEPIAVVATPMNSPATASDRNVAASAARPEQPGAAKPPAEQNAPPGAKVITITDGTSGKVQQVVIPPRGEPAAQKKSAADPQLLEETRHGQIPKVADGKRPDTVYAQRVDAPPGKAKIAIVLGGLGVSASVTSEALAKLPGPVTLAFAPYAANLDSLAGAARAQQHEVLLQAPMEPFDYPDNDPGPQTLLTSLTPSQNLDRLQWLMARMQGYVGIASMMGARFTASDAAMTPVLQEIAKRGLIYVDDGTSARSITAQVAGAQSTPFAKADIVLDAVPTPAEIDHALARLELAARDHGSAIGFANASPATIARIADWAKSAGSRGFVLVPITMVANKPKSS